MIYRLKDRTWRVEQS